MVFLWFSYGFPLFFKFSSFEAPKDTKSKLLRSPRKMDERALHQAVPVLEGTKVVPWTMFGRKVAGDIWDHQPTRGKLPKMGVAR
jgi:hypothetical protein